MNKSDFSDEHMDSLSDEYRTMLMRECANEEQGLTVTFQVKLLIDYNLGRDYNPKSAFTFDIF